MTLELAGILDSPEAAADVLRTIADEVESGCMIVAHIEMQSPPYVHNIPTEGARLTITFVAANKHDDDLLALQ